MGLAKMYLGWLRLLLFLGREMPVLSLLGGPTLQIMAPAFPKVGTGSISIHCALFAGAGVKVGARGPCTEQGSWAGLGWLGWAGWLGCII